MPGLWFAGSTAHSALHSLLPGAGPMAFTGHNQRPGSLIDLRELATRHIDLAEQVAAVRSFPITGEVDQLYVHPSWRWRGVGTVLVYSLAVASAARGWPPLWSDGERTELGEGFRNAAPGRSRSADLTYLAPPMTPPSGTSA